MKFDFIEEDSPTLTASQVLLIKALFELKPAVGDQLRRATGGDRAERRQNAEEVRRLGHPPGRPGRVRRPGRLTVPTTNDAPARDAGGASGVPTTNKE